MANGHFSQVRRRAWMGVAVQHGFTLIELVMVIVLLGVLAAVAGPRILNIGIFNTRGFHDQTLAYLRYAQKAAVAQRRTVCVGFTSNTVTLAIASTAGSNTCTAGLLSVPLGSVSGVLSAKPGIVFSSSPAPVSFNFDGLGQPVSASTGLAQATQKFQVSGSADFITVEATTGYVHE